MEGRQAEMRTDALVSQTLIMTFRAVFIADSANGERGYIASHRRQQQQQQRRREKGDNNEEEKSGEERRRWLARWGERRCVLVLVATVAGVVYDDGGAGRCGGGGGGDGGGEIYTGCQPPNNVIALYKLRERGEQRCSTLKPPSAP
ncbi:hypothetical protein ALC62_13835 [Cyphomyrmex costatus]|uniref:Uncharacterized protein n=1 Tax=Cyphomyrmex costatus TaxID=456900 RepID=A0A195C3I0_9HYME|nr:hypothetical protein ALC62_13835 [Cyphomyrmex costatus]